MKDRIAAFDVEYSTQKPIVALLKHRYAPLRVVLRVPTSELVAACTFQTRAFVARSPMNTNGVPATSRVQISPAIALLPTTLVDESVRRVLLKLSRKRVLAASHEHAASARATTRTALSRRHAKSVATLHITDMR